jgi:tetratricopeptide (TPR) repeat protein
MAMTVKRAHGGLLALVLASLLFASCGGQRPELRDPAMVETLRFKITKVRNAIVETRDTIALSRGAPYLPELYFRLAELLSEEARYHYQLAFEREQRSSRVLHVPQVRVLKEQAISLYKLVLNRFPDSGLGPQVLFNIGHEYRELGNFDDMRATLQQLISDYPEAALRFDAMLVLGDYHFDRNELDAAGEYYKKIVSGELSKISGLAHYKLAWVWVNQGECEKAIDDFDKAIVRSNDWEALSLASGVVSRQDIDVRRESLVDMAYCYARERKPYTTVPYLRKMAYNRPTYIAALGRFASRYRVMERPEGAIAVTRELLALGPANRDRLDDAFSLVAGLKKAKNYNWIASDIKLVVGALTRYVSRLDLSDEERSRLSEQFELVVRDLLTSAQGTLLEQESESQPGFARELAGGYRVFLDTFPTSSAYLDMVLNAADMLETGGMNLEAGLRFAQAAGLMEDSPEKSTALYDAIIQFQKSLEKEADRSQFERVTARAALREAAKQLLAFTLEPDKERRVKFAIAQSYYDAGRYQEAIDRLTAVAYEYPNSVEGDGAIRLVLDSYNTLNDFDGLMYSSRRFMSPDSPASAELRTELNPILLAAEQRKLDELALQAAGEDGGDISVLEEFALQNPNSPLGERALLNAFVAARAVGESDTLYQLAEDLAQQYPDSEQLPGVYSTIAQTAVGRFEFEQAIRFMQQASAANPEQQISLLMVSGDLSEQLGDYSGAEQAFLDAARAAEGTARVDALARYSALVELRNNPRETISRLTPFENEGGPDLHARLGLAHLSVGDVDTAEGHLQTALDDPNASPDASARAQLGMAEVMLATFDSYPDPSDLDMLQEFVLLIEVVEDGYLTAARSGSYTVAAVALGRLAFAANKCADRLSRVAPPFGLSSEETDAIRAALDQRVNNLRETSRQALDYCGQQAWSSKLLSPAVRQCLQGQALDGSLSVTFDTMRGRSPASPAGIDEQLKAISKNPEDAAALRTIGLAFLQAGDPHVARLAFARAVQSGGGPEDSNLLGIASYRAGDLSGAFEAFSMAASAGLDAGRQNMMSVLREAGLNAAAERVMELYPGEAKPGGRLLNE